MSPTARWVVAVIAVIAIVALILWARGVRIRDVVENPTASPAAFVLEVAA
jgi:hypothetical protein